jgi:hypothetical protein
VHGKLFHCALSIPKADDLSLGQIGEGLGSFAATLDDNELLVKLDRARLPPLPPICIFHPSWVLIFCPVRLVDQNMVSWMNCENQFATVISVPIMWQTGQRLDSHLAAFPLYLLAPVLERKPLPLF